MRALSDCLVAHATWQCRCRYWCDDNIRYQIQWLKCLRDQYNIESDYLGVSLQEARAPVDKLVLVCVDPERGWDVVVACA